MSASFSAEISHFHSKHNMTRGRLLVDCPGIKFAMMDPSRGVGILPAEPVTNCSRCYDWTDLLRLDAGRRPLETVGHGGVGGAEHRGDQRS